MVALAEVLELDAELGELVRSARAGALADEAAAVGLGHGADEGIGRHSTIIRGRSGARKEPGGKT